jgi:hybrid cluster-associated redox disulfide protein
MSEEISPVRANMVINKVVELYPQTVQIFAKHGLGCVSCAIAGIHTVESGALSHKVPVAPLLADLNLAVTQPELFPLIKTGGLAPITPGTENLTTGGIKNVIAIVSGKGGVGKSYVTSTLAVGLNRLGKRVGILDADITGPSIPRTFGVTARPAEAEDKKIVPVISAQGIKIMSSLFFVPDEDKPIIWRGPLISRMIRRFYEETLWGELDYLLIDLPPGTSDAPLTVMQFLSVKGIVLVNTPQMLATSIVRKAIGMMNEMNVPILGVVENMSWLDLPDSGKRFNLFGESLAESLSHAANAPVLAKLPLDPRAAEMVDDGQIENYHSKYSDELAQNFLQAGMARVRTSQMKINISN